MIQQKTYPQAQPGFSLVEMAIVLAIVALLMAGLLPTLSSQIEQQRRNETNRQLAEIQQALLGYAVSNGHLPCPAKSASDGTEDRDAATGTCNKRVGFFPWVEVGTSKTDGWGRIFLYSATNAFTNAAPAAMFTLTSFRDITIKSRDTGGALVNQSKVNDIPAVVLSSGQNGIFGTTSDGIVVPSPAPAGTNNVDDQSQNVNGTIGAAATGTAFMSRDPASPASSTDEAFDDLVVWISPNTLFNRMVTASKLP